MPSSGAHQTDPKSAGSGELGRRAARAAGWLGPWLAVSALGLWTSSPDTASLLVAALGVAAALLWGRRRRSVAWGLGLALIVVAMGLAVVARGRANHVLSDFDSYWAQRDTAVGGILSQELDRYQKSGETAANELARAWNESRDELDVGYVRDLRARHGVSALALYDSVGTLRLWDGVHRGRVPERIKSGAQGPYAYHDFPLFGYLYITSVADDGSVAVAAFLLRASLPESLDADPGDFASAFFRETHEHIRITEADPLTEAAPGAAYQGVVWDLGQGSNRLLSVVVDRPQPEVRAQQIMDRWSGGITLLILGAWLALALAGPRRLGDATVASVTLLLLAAWVPLDQVPAFASVFDASAFGLPGPVPLSLGRFALIGVAAFAVLSVLPRPRLSLRPWVAGAAVAVAFPILVLWAKGAPAPGSLAVGRLDFVVYEVGVAALLALLAGVAITLSRARRGFAWAGVGAFALAVVLSAGAAAWVRSTARDPLWWTPLWALPVWLAAFGARAWEGWRRSLVGWGLGIVVGGTAAIPVTWAHRVEARMAVGEDRLRDLAATDDPPLERALVRFGALADSLDRAGRDDVSMLYDGWRMSGLADGAYPVWLQLWHREGSPGAQLRVGVEGVEPAPLQEALQQTWLTGAPQLLELNRDDARYVLTTELQGERVVSVVAPPFEEGTTRSGLGPLLRGSSPDGADPLTVIPLFPGEPHEARNLDWVKVPGGWQAEMALRFANQTAYHAHYLVTLPGSVLGVARGTLLLALNLLLFFGAWLVGQALVTELRRRELRLAGLVISFRARVTLALFGFFALANALFGTMAYRTLSLGSRRSAQVIAERVGEDAAGWYGALRGQIQRLARQVGAELLEYRDGELVEGSVPELVELGLYEGWAPYPVVQLLGGREVVSDFTETSVGNWEYVTAYRALPAGDILAAQVPMQAGTTALQTTDLVELLGFVVILGALLSAALAMLAGRALTRPIQALRTASERVGAGDLAQRLPVDRADEFAPVFQAFNRMVGRVRRARRQLIRTSRRTQLIMDEAAVGMVALDAAGRVTLVNPRAGALLGGEVQVGEKLPEDGPLAEELAPWLTEFLQGGLEEADGEFQAGDRRVRVRVRRLGSHGTHRGAVVAMDDVTDELRAERVLAWGEMARQVAHEVKNPLTPIKLSIQHVRRAWDDQHPQFQDILIRNADAMLSEIERLAGIATSFSRFGAPGGSATPLAPVSVEDVISEVMALYGGSAGKVRFEQDVEPGLPLVVSRSAELKEVLVNLLENARVSGGDRTVVSIVARRTDSDTVAVTVVDNGAGIPQDVVPRIFEPQFSTRSTGTGLGLAIVQRLVRSWGGSVDVESTVGEGTSVSVSMGLWRPEIGIEAGSAAGQEPS